MTVRLNSTACLAALLLIYSQVAAESDSSGQRSQLTALNTKNSEEASLKVTSLGICGSLTVDPSTMLDPMYQGYPDRQAPAAANALHLASLIGTWYEIDGFKVFLRDTARTYVGLLPAFYTFSPDLGTTSVYSALEDALPCMVKGLRQKPQFWLRRLPSTCQANLGFLLCNQSDVAPVRQAVEKYIRRSNAGEKRLEKVCNSPFVVDGSVDTMLQWRSGHLADVDFDMAVFLSAITPGARFIALAPGSAAKHVRSNFFYFSQHSAAQYSKALHLGIAELEEQAKSLTTCSQLLTASNTFERQNAIVRSASAFANSCNILRFAVLFPDRVFLSSITELFDCSDGFKEWMGSLWGSQECFPEPRHENLPTPHLKEHISRLESEFALVLGRRHYQIKPIAMGGNAKSACKVQPQSKTVALAAIEPPASRGSDMWRGGREVSSTRGGGDSGGSVKVERGGRDVEVGAGGGKQASSAACVEGCSGPEDGGLAGVNDKYAGASVLVATILTSVTHMQYVDGCIAVHVMLRRLHPGIPSVAFVVSNTQPELAAAHRAAVARMQAAGLQVVEIKGMADGKGYNGGTFGTWIGQTTKFMLWQLTRIQRVVYFDNDVQLLGSMEALLAACKLGSGSDALLCARPNDTAWNRAHWCTIYFEAFAFVIAPAWSVWLELEQASLRLAQGPFVAPQHDGDPHGYCARNRQPAAVVTEQDFMNKFFAGRVLLFDDKVFGFMKHCKPWPQPHAAQACSPEVTSRFRQVLSSV